MSSEKIGNKQSVDYLITALKNNDWEIRLDAVKHLRKLKDPRSTDALRLALRDTDEDIRKEASTALYEITGNTVDIDSEPTLEKQGNISTWTENTEDAVIIKAQGKAAISGTLPSWTISLFDDRAVFQQETMRSSIAVPRKEIASYISLSNASIAGHNVILNHSNTKHRMFMNQKDVDKFAEWIGKETVKELVEKSAGLHFGGVIQKAIFIAFAFGAGLGLIKGIQTGNLAANFMSSIGQSISNPYVVGLAVLLSLIIQTVQWFAKSSKKKQQ